MLLNLKQEILQEHLFIKFRPIQINKNEKSVTARVFKDLLALPIIVSKIPLHCSDRLYEFVLLTLS